MMRTVALPYSGELLLTQLMAYGTLVALEHSGVCGTVGHDPFSLTCDPIIELPADVSDGDVATAIAETARVLEDAIEEDLVVGKSGNDRRSVIWARGSFAGDETQAREPVARRTRILDSTTGGSVAARRLATDLLAALGSPVTWGGGDLKPSVGATALDGVLGNHTSDLVRGVLRPARQAAQEPAEPLWTASQGAKQQLDKTGWAPPGTSARLDHQWLAVLGMTLLPVTHRAHGRSATPASWKATTGRRSGLALPVFDSSVTLARLRALLASAAVPSVVPGILGPDVRVDVRSAATLRALGVPEIVVYERLDARGAGSSVAFSFRRGTRVAL